MSDDPWQEKGVQEWARHFLDDVYPKMDESSFVISIAPPEGGGDVKFWVELGASIMLDKPIIVVSVDGREIPEKLRLVADEVVSIDADSLSANETPSGLTGAIERTRAKLRAES